MGIHGIFLITSISSHQLHQDYEIAPFLLMPEQGSHGCWWVQLNDIAVNGVWVLAKIT